MIFLNVLLVQCRQEDILVCLTLLEEAGLPQLLVSIASPENSLDLLGDVLAATVKAWFSPLNFEDTPMQSLWKSYFAKGDWEDASSNL